MPGFTEISPAQLARLIGTPDAPRLIDVCIPEDVAADPFVIPTSKHVPHSRIPDWVAHDSGGPVVVVCQKGRKLSHGTAALLRSHGIQAEVLAGGMAAWVAADLPRIAITALPASDLWVTRARPKIDRIACPWLIRRFIAPDARFLFVPAADVNDIADRFGAIAFDTPGAPYAHQDERCTFDDMLDKFGLTTPALSLMGDVIRAADTNRHDLAPQAAGLLALSVGLSRMFKDDVQQLAAGLSLYDALYRWARDGADELHDRPQDHRT